MLLSRAHFKKKDSKKKDATKELYYLLNPNFRTEVYLNHAALVFSGKADWYMTVTDKAILETAKNKGMYPIEEGDTIAITNNEGTEEYERTNDGWKLVNKVSGVVNIPELMDTSL